MKKAKFLMYVTMCGWQTVDLPDDVDATSEDEVKDYLSSVWDDIPVPTDLEYVGDDGFDRETPLTIFIEED